MEYKVIIAGGREFSDYQLLKAHCDIILSKKTKESDIVIVSGKARGADTLGEQYAKEYGYSVEEHPADWDRFGKAAGYRRNKEMAENADACICFWDGKSKGTKHMIDIATEMGLPLRIIRY